MAVESSSAVGGALDGPARSALPNRIIFVLSLAGAAVSGYLTLAHLQAARLGCGQSVDCEKVAQHYTARGFGIPGLEAIPTAAFGLLLYAALAILSFVRVAGSSSGASRAALLQWLAAAAGVIASAWLTYLEAFVIHAWCRWCLASAGILLLIFLTAASERLRVFARPRGETT